MPPLESLFAPQESLYEEEESLFAPQKSLSQAEDSRFTVQSSHFTTHESRCESDIHLFSSQESEVSSFKRESSSRSPENILELLGSKHSLSVVSTPMRESSSVEKLQNEVSKLKGLLQAAEKEIEKNKLFRNNLETNLSSILSPRQISVLGHEAPSNIRKYTDSEIVNALELRCLSRKTYCFLSKKLPFPSISTIKRTLSNIKTSPGFIEFSFNVLRTKFNNFSYAQTTIALSFDEMEVHNVACYDRSRDLIIGPFKKMLVIFARGILAKWKIPLYFNFDTDMSSDIF